MTVTRTNLTTVFICAVVSVVGGYVVAQTAAYQQKVGKRQR